MFSLHTCTRIHLDGSQNQEKTIHTCNIVAIIYLYTNSFKLPMCIIKNYLRALHNTVKYQIH